MEYQGLGEQDRDGSGLDGFSPLNIDVAEVTCLV